MDGKKRNIAFFNSFGSNVTKQDARFCCPRIYLTLNHKVNKVFYYVVIINGSNESF